MTNKTAYAVIGANYGDEGKGLATDYFCAESTGPTTVIRFNGGAQAGHTVVTPSGTRHVFHHFGSGSFQFHVKTHLSQHFVCNPILFHGERKELMRKGVVAHRISADPRCIVTTPWDMMINRLAETKLGGAKHGSCGLGINETVTRNAETTYGFTLEQARSSPSLKNLIRGVQHDYVPYRLEQVAGLRLSDLSKEELENFTSEGIAEHYIKDLRQFLVHVQLLPTSKVLDQNIVFEGAQGLGLDERRGVFPHVTRSSTGLQNVMDLCPELDIDVLKAVYITRPYITRHGEGPLALELDSKPWESVQDLTNGPNKWQGALRYGTLDEVELSDRITLDLGDARYKTQNRVRIDPALMLTCVDQIPGLSLAYGKQFAFLPGGVTGTVQEFIAKVRRHIGTRTEDPCWLSLGPTRSKLLRRCKWKYP